MDPSSGECQGGMPGDGIFSSGDKALVSGSSSLNGTGAGTRTGQRQPEGAQGDVLVGGILAGKYFVERILGEGGWGKVYLGIHQGLEKKVAIKVLHPHLLDDSVKLMRFEREATVLAKLDHPGLVGVHDYGLVPQPYLVMDYVEGVTLADWLKTGKLEALSQATAIIVQVGEALSYAHGQGIVHRDLKPSNIMLSAVGDCIQAKILDFGNVKFYDEQATSPGEQAPDLTQTGLVVGSPPYMSPEQWRGLASNPRSDIYSLGVIMYELLVGRRPFSGTTAAELIHQHLTCQPPAITGRSRVGKISADLNRVVMTCLVKEPNERYQSVEELLADLKTISAKSKLSWWRATALYLRSRRNRWAAVVCGAAALLTIVGLVIYRDALADAFYGQAYQAGQRALKAKQYALAEYCLGTANNTAKFFHLGPGKQLRALRDLVETYKSKGFSPELAATKQLIQELEGGDVSPSGDVYLQRTFRALQVEANVEEARRNTRGALFEAEKLGRPTVFLAFCKHAQALAFEMEGDAKHAEQYGIMALRTAEDLLDPNDSRLADFVGFLGLHYRLYGNFEQAERYTLEHLRLLEIPSNNMLDRAQSPLSSLADIYCRTGKMDKAEQVFAKWKKLATQLSGANSNDVLKVMTDHAACLGAAGRFQEACAELSAVVKAKDARNSWAFNDPNNTWPWGDALLLATLGDMEMKLGHLHEAEVAYRRSYAASKLVMVAGPARFAIVRSLVACLRKEGKAAEAAQVLYDSSRDNSGSGEATLGLQSGRK